MSININKYRLNSAMTVAWGDILGDISEQTDLTEKLEDYPTKEGIKTINGNSLIGTGDIQIGDGLTIDEVDEEIDGKLEGYATEEWVEGKGYLTEHQSLEGYAKTTDIPTKTSELTNDSGYLTEHQSLAGYATETWVGKNYVKREYISYWPDETLKSNQLGGKWEQVYDDLSSGNVDADYMVITLRVVPSTHLDTYYRSDKVAYLSSGAGYDIYFRVGLEQWTLNINKSGDEYTWELTKTALPEITETETWVEGKGYLTEHQTLKTVNGNSLVGEGDITIEGGDTPYVAEVEKEMVDDQEVYTFKGDPAELKAAIEKGSVICTLFDEYHTAWVYGDTYVLFLNYDNEIICIVTDGTEANVEVAPYIEIPTKTSELTNDSGFTTEDQLDIVQAAITKQIPTKTSQLTNDSGFLTEHQSLKTVNGNSLVGEGDITIEGGDTPYVAEVEKKMVDDQEVYTFKGDPAELKAAIEKRSVICVLDYMYYSAWMYSDTFVAFLIYGNMMMDINTDGTEANVEVFPYVEIPTKTSQLTNDSGYLTEHQSLEGYASQTWVTEQINAAVGDAETITNEILA